MGKENRKTVVCLLTFEDEGDMERELEAARTRVAILQQQLRDRQNNSSTSVAAANPDFQANISNRLSTGIFAPYSQGSQPSTSSTYASVSSRTLQNFRVGGRSRVLHVPRDNGNSVVPKKFKSDATDTFWFFLLGDPKEDMSPTCARKKKLGEHGLATAKLVTLKNGSPEVFKADFDAMLESLSSICSSWEMCYSDCRKENSQLFRFSDSTLTCTDFKRFKQTASVHLFYLRPLSTVLPLTDDFDSVTAEIGNTASEVNEENSYEIIHPITRTNGTIEINVTKADSDIIPSLDVLEALNSLALSDYLLRIKRGIASTTRVIVNRTPTFPTAHDILVAFKDENVSPLNKFFVYFDEENGVDVGGLTREFYWKAHRSIAEECVLGFPMFDGMEDHRMFSSHKELHDSGMYKGLARFMVQSFVNIGVLLPGLSRPAFQFITGCSVIDASDPMDCPEYEDQQIASIIDNLKRNPITVTRAEVDVARTALEKIFIRGPLTKFNAPYNLIKFCEHAIIEKRRETLEIVMEIIMTSIPGQYLQKNQHYFENLCPDSGKFQPPSNTVIDAIGNLKSVDNDTSKNLKRFIHNIENYGHSIGEFLQFVTASPILTQHGIWLKISEGSCIYSKTCMNDLYIPVGLNWTTFKDLMLAALDKNQHEFSLP
ncbi:unnamed protein product [Allacma fusca]|uniref:HECT domain-containing protein n=1 Tax=Allacma fusca TaxID=39272 RepID=A0A8J2PQ26_9HEXA|nr:unnamed protein product [Allacma fusca]